jgi:hypothetical protein
MGMVMDGGPTRRERSPELVPVLAAHERRARLIAQIKEQAIAAANAGGPAQHTAKKSGHSRWREADGIIATGVLKIIAVTALIVLLGCILVRLP